MIRKCIKNLNLNDAIKGDKNMDFNEKFDADDKNMERVVSGSTNYYGICTTAAEITEKIVTVEGNFVLAEGAAIDIKFTNTNSASVITINVNNTGSKAVKKYGSTSPNTYQWQTGAVVRFVYDGIYWIMQNGTTATTTYYGVTKLNSSTNSTSKAEAATPSAVKAVMDIANAASAAALAAAEESLPLYGGTLEGGAGDKIEIYPYDGDRPAGELTGPRIALVPSRKGITVPLTDIVISAGVDGNYIKGLDMPVEADEAVNKQYVDSLIMPKTPVNIFGRRITEQIYFNSSLMSFYNLEGEILRTEAAGLNIITYGSGLTLNFLDDHEPSVAGGNIAEFEISIPISLPNLKNIIMGNAYLEIAPLSLKAALSGIKAGYNQNGNLKVTVKGFIINPRGIDIKVKSIKVASI